MAKLTIPTAAGSKNVCDMNIDICKKILLLRYLILIHSCAYYELDNSMISDFQFDKLAKDLVDLQRRYPNESKHIPFYKDFATFDGITGFYLPIRDVGIINLTKECIKHGL